MSTKQGSQGGKPAAGTAGTDKTDTDPTYKDPVKLTKGKTREPDDQSVLKRSEEAARRLAESAKKLKE